MPFRVFRKILRKRGITELLEKLVDAAGDRVCTPRIAVDEFIERDDLVDPRFLEPEYEQGRPHGAVRRRCDNEVEDGVSEHVASCMRLNFSLRSKLARHIGFVRTIEKISRFRVAG